jgi:hypothetical protein
LRFLLSGALAASLGRDVDARGAALLAVAGANVVNAQRKPVPDRATTPVRTHYNSAVANSVCTDTGPSESPCAHNYLFIITFILGTLHAVGVVMGKWLAP